MYLIIIILAMLWFGLIVGCISTAIKYELEDKQGENK